MRNPLLVPEFQELLEGGQEDALREFCDGCHPVSVAEFVSALDPPQAWAVLRLAEPVRRAEIFTHLDEEFQEDTVRILRREEIAQLFTHMPPDDRANLFRKLPGDRQELVMPALAQAEREDIRRLTSYAEGTAGSIMTSDYVTLPPEITVAEAIDHLRRVAPDKETIYYAYVVDTHRKLLGFVSLRDLILARRDKRVNEIYHDQNVIFIRSDEDQEEAVRTIQKFDLIALPVVNPDHALVGIITYDDAIDVITQEHTEDMEKLMGIGGSHEGTYLRASSWGHFRNRAGWVAALGVIGMLSGHIVHHYEDLLHQYALLAAFMPMLAASGGNTGSQSASLIVRGLAVQELAPRDLPRILWKELQISLMLGALLAGLVLVRVLFLGGSEAAGLLGSIIALAVGLQVVSSTLIGALLPLTAAKLRFDPAVVASPALTTIVDMSGLLIYFAIASRMLGV